MSETRPRQIAWIGTGVMGAPMAGHLLDAGHHLRLYSRTRAKAEGLIGRGATWAATPAEAAEGADVAISMVGVPDDVRESHMGDQGTLRAARRPPLLIDMTTSRPSLALEIAREAQRLGAVSIDAPVSGGDVGARNATLSIMVGGDLEAVARARPIFEKLGRTIVHQGGPGAGQHTKMVNQILIAGTMLSVVEGLRYARAAGLDAERVIASVGSGAAGSWSINNMGPRILKGDFEPGFYVEHFVKDLSIAIEEAEAMALDLPCLALAKRFYDLAVSHGLGRKGTQVLYLLMEQMGTSKVCSPACA